MPLLALMRDDGDTSGYRDRADISVALDVAMGLTRGTHSRESVLAFSGCYETELGNTTSHFSV